MTAVEVRGSSRTQLAQLLRSARQTWFELPRVVAASGIWMLGWAPIAVAGITGSWWVVALSALPLAVLTTGLARIAATVAAGGRARVADLLRVDPVLALLVVAAGTAAERLIAAGGALQVAGFSLAAAVVMVAPLALAYGAVRGRTGVSAVRGGAILAVYRPSVALSFAALSCIGGFAVVASLGALGVVVPCLVAAFGSSMASGLLESIDSRGGSR